MAGAKFLSSLITDLARQSTLKKHFNPSNTFFLIKTSKNKQEKRRRNVVFSVTDNVTVYYSVMSTECQFPSGVGEGGDGVEREEGRKAWKICTIYKNK